MARKHAATVHGDLRELGALFPHPHRSFDGIWACAALVHLSRAATADMLAQFARLLVPDGKLYVTVPATGASGWVVEADARRYYTVWTPDAFTGLVTTGGCTPRRTVLAEFTEVWATRDAH